MAGWIKIYRDLQDHWLAQDMEKLGRWTSLLLMATHEDKKVLVGNQLIELKRGQLIASNSFLADRWKISERSVLRFLDLLESDSMLHRCTHRKVTILTVCNYDSYQEKRKSKVTNTCTDEAPIAHRKVTELKNVEECKELNITSTAGAYACTCEELAAKYRAENNWKEVGIMIHAKSVDEVIALFEEFVTISKHDGKSWSDFSDFKRHFRQWATKQVQKKPAKSETKKEPKVISGSDIYKVYG